MKDANEYFYRICTALKANKINTKAAYREFDNFWEDFEFGLKDFPYAGTKLRAFYYAELKKEWDAPAAHESLRRASHPYRGLSR